MGWSSWHVTMRLLSYAAMIMGFGTGGLAFCKHRIAIIPPKTQAHADSQGEIFSAAIRVAMAQAGWDTVSAGDIARFLGLPECSGLEGRAAGACALTIADSLGATAALVGSLTNSDGTIEAQLWLYEMSTRSKVWTHIYGGTGPIAAFSAQTAAKVCSSLSYRLSLPNEQVTIGPTEPLPSALGKNESEKLQNTDAEKVSFKLQSPLLGIQAIATIGGARQPQSRGGGQILFAFPTTLQSYARIKLGIPLYHSSEGKSTIDEKLPDPYLSLEHEWNWSHFAIGCGMAYMYLHQFSLQCAETVYDHNSRSIDVDAHFGSSHAVGISFNLRGGRPNAGFYGRIAWPWAYILYDNKPNNFFLEYNAMGVYGRNNFRFGVGVTGMVKFREADYVIAEGRRYKYEDANALDYDDTNLAYSDFSCADYTEFFSLIPCLKTSWIVGTRTIITGILDLGGTLIPRFMDAETKNWLPSVGVNIAYSFGNISHPSPRDGSF